MPSGDAVLRFLLAILITAAFIGLLVVIVVVQPAESVPFRDVLLVMVGTLVSLVKDVYGFLFGSSSGSKDANDTMKQIAVKATVNGSDKPPTSPEHS